VDIDAPVTLNSGQAIRWGNFLYLIGPDLGAIANNGEVTMTLNGGNNGSGKLYVIRASNGLMGEFSIRTGGSAATYRVFFVGVF
jgi:hypothetical protein